jgi:hypothetical protein
VLDLPQPLFCFVDPENGLYTYDGTTLVHQEIPKYVQPDPDNPVYITGACWLDQDDGRLYVAGNITDAGEHRVLYYCASGDTTKWTSDTGGGSLLIYGSDSRSGNANPKWCRGLVVHYGAICVFSEDTRHVVAGVGTLSQQQEVFAKQGCWSGKCISKHDGIVYWWGKDGAYAWRGGPIADRISDNLWNKVQDVKFVSSYKWFSFVFMDQWWTCVRYKNATLSGLGTVHGYHNFLYDFKTHNWYVNDIPMVAAFSSLGGLTDIGRLYFASPIDTGTNEYKCYTYGFDEVAQKATYADACYTDGNDRKGTAITAVWETGKLGGGNITAGLPTLSHVAKTHLKFITELDTNDSDGITAPTAGGVYTSAKVEYRADRDAAYGDLANFGTGSQTNVFQHLYPNDKIAHYIQYKFSVVSTKQTILYEAFNVFTDEGISLTDG